MANMKIRITLLSDMCVSDGSVYNSSLDTDVCYDTLGLPDIPAKRLKGCLRECAQELSDWGDDIRPDVLFGKEGDVKNQSLVRISNAMIENADNVKNMILKSNNVVLYHPQNILSRYSYIRMQTSIDEKTGTAKEGSLRSMRVIDKETVFESEVCVDENEVESLRKCVAVLSRMGMSRTRGLGEVQCELLPMSNTQTMSKHCVLAPNATMLKYEITLKEPMVCKSFDGEEENTLDYIEGSKILGIVLQELKNSGKDIEFVLKSPNAFFSNAYVGKDNVRYLEVPACFSSIKNDKIHYINNAYYESEKDERQLNQMKHCYVDVKPDGLSKIDVETEERYHHRRPDDKSIGHAREDGSGKSEFYQINSISEGQTFYGMIVGNQDLINASFEALTKHDDYYIGYGRSSEYGKVRIRIIETSDKKDMTISNRILVKLESPTIVYSNKAFYSVETEDLIDEITSSLGISDRDILEKRTFVNYGTIGGFNTTWQLHKPIINVFDKGTCVVITLKNCVTVPQRAMVGERCMEGYGEISIFDYSKAENEANWIIKKVEKSSSNRMPCEVSDTFTNLLAKSLFVRYSGSNASHYADQYCLRKLSQADKMRPVVANLVSICKESSNMDDVISSIEYRFNDTTSPKKRAKYEIAKDILASAQEAFPLVVTDFTTHYLVDIKNCDWVEKQEVIFLLRYLEELRYQIRANKERNKNE